MRFSILTRISYTDSDVTPLELATIEGQGLLQSIKRGEFCVTEALRLHLQFILDNTDVRAFALGKEIGDIANCGIEGQVAEVYSIRGLVG